MKKRRGGGGGGRLAGFSAKIIGCGRRIGRFLRGFKFGTTVEGNSMLDEFSLICGLEGKWDYDFI